MGMLPEPLVGLDRIVSWGQIGPLARMRGPKTSTAGECAEAAPYAGERVAKVRQSAGPTESAAARPRDERNPASGERNRPSGGSFGTSRGLSVRHGHPCSRLLKHGTVVPTG